MKTRLGVFSVLVLIGLLISCVTGEYMSLRPSEQGDILGTIQSTFNVNGAYRYRGTINRQAHISLLAEAQNKYPDTIVDIRDISWAMGQFDAANNNYEYSAIGKVIRLPK